MPDSSRLFVGTFVGDKEVAAINLIEEANPTLAYLWNIRVRFVPNEKLHLTWLFLGNVERAKIPAVEIDLQTAIDEWKISSKVESLTIRYDRLQVWPTLNSPRVLVLEATEDLKLVRALNKSISMHLQAFCQSKAEVERFDVFRPHITVCRFSAQKGPKLEKNRELSSFKIPEKILPIIQKVGTLSLIESDLNSQSIEQHELKKGAYQIIKPYQLNGSKQ